MKTLLAWTLLFTAAIGCGIQPSKDPVSNIIFENRLGDEIHGQDSNFDLIPIGDSSNNLVVSSESGSKVTLDVLNAPLFFEAYWCPHCQRTLVLFNEHEREINKLPVIISTGFPPGTDLQQAVNVTKTEFTHLGLHGFTIYYLLGDTKGLIPQFPAMMFRYNGLTATISGEHTWDIWKQAITGRV